ncbi:DUF6973 domain-containing protein [Flagellimonas allohymeniacidonis]|uniref:DUF6973 domain-containing protein n=1 Tax=Flagellimonas allohymeniacidonis TaxID=2517819 RepID=A0A4Q8QD47_9FLAO|nr:hypothetical protein [Allomuricauda hymeniacidonis]TAI47437.1 hypothetical protein EW142_12250 [Allomuricauda hymeniacidonis]
MKLVKTLGRVGIDKLWALLILVLKNIPFVVPTILATKRCVGISTQYYGRRHYQNGPANAFRHALWNYLIVKSSLNWWKNENWALRWSQQITDWHEEAFQNIPLAKAMDYHNNEVGRSVFIKHRNDEPEDVIQLLRKMTEASIPISSESELLKLKHRLVHITEPYEG